MPVVNNPTIYEAAREEADQKYGLKTSAYKSGWLVKRYKELGGTYSDDGKEQNLARWFKEEWKDIGSTFGKSRAKMYPVLRPTKRISKDTPLTVDEIDKTNLAKQIELKQKIKGEKNLPAFEKKN